jgi:hypothetical protein
VHCTTTDEPKRTLSAIHAGASAAKMGIAEKSLMSEVTYNLTDLDFLQGGLDFSGIIPVEFENLVFHLLDEMGFSNIKWRKGGEGNSATDGGRDLEATFWSVGPGIAKEEKYWFEVKYRSNQLEKSQIQNTILNASGDNAKDHLVIITNKTISNPTLDWIEQFRGSHKRPIVTVWQGHDLELLLRKNPRTLARFIPSSLLFSGRCKVIESRFSNLVLLPSGGELDELWEKRDQFSENSYLTMSSIFGEVSYGDVAKHPWGIQISKELLFAVFVTGMANVYPLVFKCSSLNREQSILVNGLSYLAQCSIIRLGADITAEIFLNTEKYLEVEYTLPEELRVNRYEPVFHTMLKDIGVYCSAKYCSKVHHMSKPDDFDYFGRFSVCVKSSPHPIQHDPGSVDVPGEKRFVVGQG